MDLAYSGRSPTDTNRFSVDFLPGLLLTISSLAMVISYCEGTISAAVGVRNDVSNALRYDDTR